MNSLSIALIALVCIVGGALFGMFLSTLLPEHHFTSESKDTVKLGAGLIATMAALVLGLLVGSAKNSFDAMTNGITQISAKTIMLDRALAHYGPETQEVREMVRDTVGSAMRHIWPEEKNAPQHPAIPEKSDGMERIQSAILALAPHTDTQRQVQAQALQISSDLAQLRWTLIEQQATSLPTSLLVVLVVWLAALFASFGIFAPRHATAIAALCVSALSVSGALFIILEMNKPLDGVIKISSGPLHKALAILGK